MESAAAAEKQCDMDKLSENDKALAVLYERYGEVYINENTVLTCLVEIRRLIDIPILKDYLLKHRVIGTKQLDEITNHYHFSDYQMDNLLKSVGRAGGKHGYFLLYVSLCESSKRHRGHEDAVQELKKKAKELEVVAPESILCACRMLHQQQKLKHDKENSADKQDSGYESNMDDLIYRCNCGGDCSLHDYLNGSGCQKPTTKGFQYLRLPSDSYEATQLEITLSKQSKALSKEFVQQVSIDTFQQLNKISFEEVKRYAKHMISTGNYENVTSGHQPVTTCFAETTTLEQLEDVLMQYYSWFNFALLKDLRKNFLFPKRTDDLLQNYEEKFSHYCKRRCFESPLPFHPKPVSVNLTSLVFKVDKMFGDYTLIDVQQITEIVADVINSPKHAIYVKSVEEGCVEVSCYILPQFQLRHLSDLQISQLKENDIFSFKMEDKELMPPCQHHLYQDDNPEQPESSSDHEGYDASSEESDSEDTPSIISDEGTFEAADDNNREDKDFDIPPSPASRETTYEENPNNSAFTDGSSKFNFSSQAVTTVASKSHNGIHHSPQQSNHVLATTKEEEQSGTDYSDMEDTGYVIQQNSNVQTPEIPTATEATDEGASTGVTPTSSMPKRKQESVVSNMGSDIISLGDYSTTDHDIDSKFDLPTVSPQRSLKDEVGDTALHAASGEGHIEMTVLNKGKLKLLWTDSFDCTDVEHSAKHPPVSDSTDVSCKKEDTFVFHFKLPVTGLALRSAAVVDGVPVLLFDTSPKVPTVTKEDVATAFRLAFQGTWPEFVCIAIAESHPSYGRQYKHHSPKWLRETSMEDVLYEADWYMKSLQVGVQSNKERTKFWSWQKKSNLDGLATVCDFPKDEPSGSVFMSCELARVEKDENVISFPQEPKMRIVDNSNSLYSKFITDIYLSVAYHDETLLHRPSILVAEWLIEKGTKISTRWMTKFTTKSDDQSESGVITSQNERKEAPRKLIRAEPIQFRRPTSDVTVKTEEAEQNRSLLRRGQYRLYGWLDHGGKEMVWCDEDGKVVEKNQSMKSVVKLGPPLKITVWSDAAKLMLTSTDVDRDTSVTKQEPILRNSHEEFTGPFDASVSVDFTHADSVNKKDGRETKVTKTLNPPPHLASQLPKITHTTTVKESVDDYDMLYSHLDPNKPIQANIPGLCEEISPDVLLFTVLWPHVMQIMPLNKGPIVAAQSGGVIAREIPITVEQRKPTRYNGETRRVDQYIQRGSTIGIQAQREVIHGEIRPANQQEFAQISDKFQRDWDSKKGSCPAVNYVFVVTNPTLEGKWNRYQQQLRIKTCEQYYHGTSLSCNITSLQKLCANRSCGICGISSDGLDTKLIRKNIQFQRFGHGFYLAPNSSKCHDYTQGANGYRAMLLCDICPGRKYPLPKTNKYLTCPPPGYDSIKGLVTANSNQNFPEIVVHNPHAVMPRYIIIYRRDGVADPLGV